MIATAAASCQVDEGYDFSDDASGAEAGSGQADLGGAGSGASTEGGSGGGGASSDSAGSAGEPELPSGGAPASGGAATGGRPQSQGGSPEATGGTETGGVPPLPSQPGAACDNDAECESDVCFDGVCCEEACAGSCYGCTRTRTNQPNGVCAPVIAGTDPYDSCAESDDACGFDGLCDGEGACRYPSATTVCAAASCVDGQLTAASQCSGDGDCVVPTATSCGDYVCANASSCRTSCSSNSHCSSSTYCKGSSCVDKEQPGVVCSAAAECESGTCSGRCCASGTPCNCPQPSAGNLIKNPGFDKDLSGWNFNTAHTWQAVDASEPGATAQCPFSGSMAVTTTSVPFSQCVNVQTDTFYNFGVRIRIQGDVDSAQCNVVLWSESNCKGENSLVQSVDVTSVSNDFSGDLTKSFNSGGYVSVEIYCFTLAAGTAVGSFDRFYLSKPPGGF